MNPTPGKLEPRSVEDAGQTDELSTALVQLESSLESPVVPGELRSWSSAVNKTLNATREPLWRELNHTHPEHYAKISRDDPDLLRRVEQMKEEDANIREAYGAYASKIGQFHQQAEQVGAHESKLDSALSEVVDAGLQLVIRIRKQRQAISTWLQEAYHRDTGVAG